MGCSSYSDCLLAYHSHSRLTWQAAKLGQQAPPRHTSKQALASTNCTALLDSLPNRLAAVQALRHLYVLYATKGSAVSAPPTVKWRKVEMMRFSTS